MIIKPENLELNYPYLILEEYEPEQEGYVSVINAEDKPIFGKVLRANPMTLLYKEDDILMITMHSTTKIPMNGKVYFLVSQEDVVGKVTKNTD